ncbi:uncharacterized protein LOC135095261 [Scylla paramamosain]|uniref:uncharacterized protein LOC135095261 n=1 Tax=Scylla paramamosain TaxID=85552 RepID=UPI003083BF53
MFVIQLEDRGRIGPQDLFANPGQVIRIEERSNHKACTTPAREGCPKAASQCHTFSRPAPHLRGKAASQCHTFSRPAPHLRGKDVPRLPPNVTFSCLRRSILAYLTCSSSCCLQGGECLHLETLQ